MTTIRSVCINPLVSGPDNGEGGISRVVRAQMAGLEVYGWRVVETPEEADVLAVHIQVPHDQNADGQRVSWAHRFPDKPIVVMNHGFYWDGYEWPAWCYQANRACLDAIIEADAVIAPSEWLASAIRHNTCREVEVIPHGIDLADWAGESGAGGYVLWNKTRVDPVCDPAPVFDLAIALPSVPFVTTLGVPGRRAPANVRIKTPGPWEQAREDIMGAAIYLCTTRETFGIGTLEALAAGVPVVGYRWGGQAEILAEVPELLDLLVEPTDEHGKPNTAALAAAVERALANREWLGLLSRELAAKYTWEPALEAYAAVFDRVWCTYQHRSNVDGPRTSIVVTAYELEQYLPEALESVLAQTDPSWECIIVDDASPDRCGEIADEYAAKDPRFIAVHNERNLYQAGARNAGITVARGRYILPLDADDSLRPETVEVLADYLDADRSTHIAYGNVWFTTEDGSPMTFRNEDGQTFRAGHSGWPIPFRFAGQNAHGKTGIGFNLLPYCSMFRREAWRLTGGYRERLRSGDDPDFWERLASYGFRPRMVTLADTLVYRNRAGSMSKVEASPDWLAWFGWHDDQRRAPAGSTDAETPPSVVSFDPPALTVVIPVGPGHERIVMDAIDSCEAQLYRRFDVIVVNDTGGDIPNLPAWVRVISTEGGTGPAHARNVGVEACRSELYLPLDADDMFEPNALRELMATWRELGGIVFPDVWHDSRETETWDHFAYADFDPLNLRNGCLHTVTALTPVEAWREVGGYDETLTAWEDWAFQVQCLAQGWCSHRVAAPLLTYRMHRGWRRESQLALKDQALIEFKNRYGSLLEEDILMACGCSKGAPTTRTPAWIPTGPGAPQAPPPGDMTLMEYTGAMQGNFGFRGAATGTTYTFSATDMYHFGYVFDADLPTFQGRLDFRPAQREVVGAGATSPTLVSARAL